MPGRQRLVTSTLETTTLVTSMLVISRRWEAECEGETRPQPPQAGWQSVHPATTVFDEV
jgi:hypothetical protein